MALDPITAIASVATDVIERIFPNPVDAANAKLSLMKLQQDGTLAQLAADTQLATSQNTVNQAEAGNASLFVSGWRPFIGWICGLGLGINYIFAPLAEFFSALAGHPAHFPRMDLSELVPLVTGMLGLGALRTYDKKKVLDANAN